MSEAHAKIVLCRRRNHSGIGRSVSNLNGLNGLIGWYQSDVRDVGIDPEVVPRAICLL